MPSFSRTQRTCVVLDLDDTLYLERDYVRSGIEAVGEWIQRTQGLRGFSEAASLLFADGVRERLFDRTLGLLDVDAKPDLVARMVHEYRRHRPAIRLAPDAAAFLDRLAGTPLAIVTDGSALSQRMKVAALNLGRRGIFPIVYTDDWGKPWWKPHPRAFDYVAATRDCTHFVYIADNPIKDFLGPRSLGWRTIQIARPDRLHRTIAPSELHQPHWTLGSFDDLPAMLLEPFDRQHPSATTAA